MSRFLGNTQNYVRMLLVGCIGTEPTVERQAGERPDLPCLLTRDQAPSSSAAPGGNTSFQSRSTETVERSSENS
jgi:hypothetical protein